MPCLQTNGGLIARSRRTPRIQSNLKNSLFQTLASLFPPGWTLEFESQQLSFVMVPSIICLGLSFRLILSAKLAPRSRKRRKHENG